MSTWDRSWPLRGFWYCSDFKKKLVPVRRIDGHAEPHGLPVTIVGRSGYLIHRNAAVRGQLEELRLGGVRRARGDSVAITDLVDVQGIGQVLYGSLVNVASPPESLRSAVG